MAGRVTSLGRLPDENALLARLHAEGLRAPHAWGNGPHERYGWHEHRYAKVLYCVGGSIVFHCPEGDVPVQAGELLDLDAGTPHAATVGPDGVRCVEAAR